MDLYLLTLYRVSSRRSRVVMQRNSVSKKLNFLRVNTLFRIISYTNLLLFENDINLIFHRVQLEFFVNVVP